jgi:rhodanese-related sulfurtransferase
VTKQIRKSPRFSLVLETGAPEHSVGLTHFEDKLAFETDPSDVWADLKKGAASFLVLDTRSTEAFEAEHIPGAISLPHRKISTERTRTFPKDLVLVTHCSGPGCNASTKGAARLAGLGFRVKEMLGGIEYWKRDGYPVEHQAPATPR